MIFDRHGVAYPTVLDALFVVREMDKHYQAMDLDFMAEDDLSRLRSDLDAIIASALAMRIKEKAA